MIFVEDNLIKVNGVVLPGLIKSIEVKSSARIDEQDVEGSSAKPKQATGYDDAKINIELIIDDTETQTKYQRLAVIKALFRKPGQAVPQPISIVCEDTAAHGIDKVLFKGLSHKAENKRGQLPVTLEFWEFIPQTIKTTSSSASKGKNGSGGSGSSALKADYTKYLSNNRGKAPTSNAAVIGASAGIMIKNREKSPAVDNANPSAALNRVAQMPYS